MHLRLGGRKSKTLGEQERANYAPIRKSRLPENLEDANVTKISPKTEDISGRAIATTPSREDLTFDHANALAITWQEMSECTDFDGDGHNRGESGAHIDDEFGPLHVNTLGYGPWSNASMHGLSDYATRPAISSRCRCFGTSFNQSVGGATLWESVRGSRASNYGT